MKRVIACAITLGLAFALFPFIKVNAASAEYVTRATNVFTNTGVGVTCVAELFFPTVNTSLPAGSEQTTIICLTLNNANDQDAFIRSCSVKLEYSSTGLNPAVSTFESFTDDLYLSRLNADGSFTIVSSTDYANSSGFVIPQHSNMTLVAAVHTVANFNTQNQNVSGVFLSAVSCSISDPVLGTYEYHGNPANLTTLTQLLSEINLEVDGLPTTLNTMINVLRSIYTRQGSIQTTVNDIYTEIVQRVYPYLSNISANTNYIVSDLNQILAALQSGSYAGTIQDSNDLQTQESNVHQQEAQWYSDNQTAIEATGLGNYQYSSGLIDSFGVARYQIAMLWNALGDWTYVYYLVFLLGLAVYILRHEPTMRVKQMRADREARLQENQIYTNASRNVRMSRDADYARHVAWGFKTRR